MKIIIAGGVGFLGSNLVKKLLNRGDEVICLDNLCTGSLENIKEFESNPNFKFINQDITKEFPSDLEADQIYHLASPASPNVKSSKSYHALWYQTMMANTTGTLNLVNLALKNQAKFLFTSTSEIYGEPLEHPQKESYRGNVSTTGPRAVYDESKRFGETIVSSFIREKGLDGRTVRIFNTYGPNMSFDDGRVVIEFVLVALEGKPFPIFGDGSSTRSFCYVDDLVEGLILSMEKEGTKGEIFNLGNPHEFSILELAKKVKELTGSSSEMDFSEPEQQDSPTKRQPDITKAKEKLGWEPKIELEEGLKRLIEFINSQRLPDVF